MRAARDALPGSRFVCKTDVKSYYNSVNHHTLLLQLHDLIGDGFLIGSVWQFLNRTVEWGGVFRTIRKGLPRASSLSPLLGAVYLLELDRRMAE